MEIEQRVSSRTVSPPERPVSLQKGVNMCGDRGSKRDEMSWLVSHTLLASFSSLELILAAPKAEQKALPETSSQMSGCHMPGHWASQLWRTQAEASGTGGHTVWPPAAASRCEGCEEREHERERSNLLSRVLSKIWIHRSQRISLFFSLDHSIVRPLQAGLILLQCASSGII